MQTGHNLHVTNISHDTSSSKNQHTAQNAATTSFMKKNELNFVPHEKRGKRSREHFVSFDDIDAEKLDDTTLEAQIREMKLRQKALSNLMKHLESKRGQIEVASISYQDKPPQELELDNYHCKEDSTRYSLKKDEGNELFQFRGVSSSWSENISFRIDDSHGANLRITQDTLVPEKKVHGHKSLPFVTSDMKHRLLQQSESPDNHRSIVDQVLFKLEDGQDAMPFNEHRELEMLSQQCTKDTIERLESDFLDRPSAEVHMVASLADESLTNSMRPTTHEQSANNMCPSKRRREDFQVGTTLMSSKKELLSRSKLANDVGQALKQKNLTSSNWPNIITVQKQLDLEDPSDRKVISDNEHETWTTGLPCSSRCCHQVATSIYGDELKNKHIDVTLGQLECEKNHRTCNVIKGDCIKTTEDVEKLRTGQFWHEASIGQGMSDLRVIKEVGASFVIDVIEPFASTNTIRHKKSIPVDMKVADQDMNNMKLNIVSDQNAKLLNIKKNHSVKDVDSEVHSTFCHIENDVGSSVPTQIREIKKIENTKRDDDVSYQANMTSNCSTNLIVSNNKSNYNQNTQQDNHQQAEVDTSRPGVLDKNIERFKQKTMSVMRGGEMVKVSHIL